MDKEEIKNRIDLNNVEPRIIKGRPTRDYIIDGEGNAIYPISPLEFKLTCVPPELEPT